jgi:hypothetical protein
MFDNITQGVITIIILWALLFGVNVNGKHYGIACGNNGVTLKMGE